MAKLPACARPVLIALAVLFMTLTTSCSRNDPLMLDSLHSIYCYQMEPSEFAMRLEAEEAKGALRAPDVAPVRIGLNVENDPDVLVSIYSDRIGKVPLYYGKLIDPIELLPPGDVFQRGGLDNFSFYFFDLKRLRICNQMQDGGAEYWKPGKTIHIEFLTEQELDPVIGTPVGHRVRMD